MISIHALLAESDESRPPCGRPTTNFYPRSPCGERHADTKNTSFHKLFLSTLSLRRATSVLWMVLNRPLFLSTLSLRRATTWKCGWYVPVSISIHALLAESDTMTTTIYTASKRFLSTLSLRRATHINSRTDNIKRFLSTLSLRRATLLSTRNTHNFAISIHALLAESDI